MKKLYVYINIKIHSLKKQRRFYVNMLKSFVPDKIWQQF